MRLGGHCARREHRMQLDGSGSDHHVDHNDDSMSTRFSARQMCIEAGGTYAPGKRTPATSALSAKALCDSRGGTYFEGGDYCEVPAVRSR